MSETLIRAISGAVYVVILLFACWYSELSFKVLMGGFLVLSTVEFSRLVRFNSLVGFVLAIGLYAGFGFFNNLGSTPDIYITIISVLTAFWLIQNLFSNRSLIISNDLVKYLLFIGYLVCSFIILAKLPFDQGVYAPNRIIGVFVLIWINDTFAYLVGKTIGKRKLIERISPKKTIEGFLGGALFTIFFSTFIARYFLNESVWVWGGIACVVVVFATLGDLVESKFKRSANVKDSGNIMPGHGGILDRLDSVIFVAPFVFLFYQILNYVS